MRRLREELNYNCLCGHLKRFHNGQDYEGYCTAYRMLSPSDDWTKDDCKCFKYKVDNLHMLEKLSQRKEVDNNGNKGMYTSTR